MSVYYIDQFNSCPTRTAPEFTYHISEKTVALTTTTLPINVLQELLLDYAPLSLSI